MLKMKRVSECYDMKVFTDEGDYFGDVEEMIVTTNKIFGWRVKATRNSFLTQVLGSAKGVVVPHPLVKSIGDIMIINNDGIISLALTIGQPMKLLTWWLLNITVKRSLLSWNT